MLAALYIYLAITFIVFNVQLIKLWRYDSSDKTEFDCLASSLVWPGYAISGALAILLVVLVVLFSLPAIVFTYLFKKKNNPEVK